MSDSSKFKILGKAFVIAAAPVAVAYGVVVGGGFLQLNRAEKVLEEGGYHLVMANTVYLGTKEHKECGKDFSLAVKYAALNPAMKLEEGLVCMNVANSKFKIISKP